jgi:formamidopyrimidine-DNA glycosylase
VKQVPELPEVETVKNELIPYVVGRHITGVTLNWEGMVTPPAGLFRARLAGRKIAALTRRGKYLIFALDNGDLLIIHLRMSGSLLVGADASSPPSYTRAVLHLDGGNNIFFRDPRKFGRMRLVEDAAAVVGKLGPEPLAAGFTTATLVGLLSGRKAPVKAVLLDQNVIAGIGNMYADEALFAASLHPLKPAGSLKPDEVKRLHRSIRRVLTSAIDARGASVSSYFRPSGQKGQAHFSFKVAHRRGEKCPVCATLLERLVIRGRGSYLCPRCQPSLSTD